MLLYILKNFMVRIRVICAISVNLMAVMPGYAVTISASSIILNDQPSRVLDTLHYPTNVVVRLNNTTGQCNLSNYIKTSIHFAGSGNIIGSITGEGNIPMPGTGTAFRVRITAEGSPPCEGSSTVNIQFLQQSWEIGTTDIPVNFVNTGCSIDLPAQITLPTVVRGDSLSSFGLTSNPVGRGTITFIPSHTNVGVNNGKIVAQNSSMGITYNISNATWKPEIVGWSSDILSTNRLIFGNTNDVGEFSGTLSATISCS